MTSSIKYRFQVVSGPARDIVIRNAKTRLLGEQERTLIFDVVAVRNGEEQEEELRPQISLEIRIDGEHTSTPYPELFFDGRVKLCAIHDTSFPVTEIARWVRIRYDLIHHVGRIWFSEKSFFKYPSNSNI